MNEGPEAQHPWEASHNPDLLSHEVRKGEVLLVPSLVPGTPEPDEAYPQLRIYLRSGTSFTLEGNKVSVGRGTQMYVANGLLAAGARAGTEITMDQIVTFWNETEEGAQKQYVAAARSFTDLLNEVAGKVVFERNDEGVGTTFTARYNLYVTSAPGYVEREEYQKFTLTKAPSRHVAERAAAPAQQTIRELRGRLDAAELAIAEAQMDARNRGALVALLCVRLMLERQASHGTIKTLENSQSQSALVIRHLGEELDAAHDAAATADVRANSYAAIARWLCVSFTGLQQRLDQLDQEVTLSTPEAPALEPAPEPEEVTFVEVAPEDEEPTEETRADQHRETVRLPIDPLYRRMIADALELLHGAAARFHADDLQGTWRYEGEPDTFEQYMEESTHYVDIQDGPLREHLRTTQRGYRVVERLAAVEGLAIEAALSRLENSPYNHKALIDSAVSHEIIKRSKRWLVAEALQDVPMSVARKLYLMCDEALGRAVREFDDYANVDGFDAQARRNIARVLQLVSGRRPPDNQPDSA